MFAERFNKKCKNLTGNKHLPIQSLATSMVLNGTARYFRWKRGMSPSRNPKTRVTEVVGKSQEWDIPENHAVVVQRYLQCGCRLVRCEINKYSRVLIGGKRFNAGEKLRSGGRCGSVVTTIMGGRSVFGLIKTLFRVQCMCHYIDFALVTLFPPPIYPDGDPLTCKIDLGGIDVNNLPYVRVLPINDIQPSRIGVELDVDNDCMYIYRFDGYNTI